MLLARTLGLAISNGNSEEEGVERRDGLLVVLIFAVLHDEVSSHSEQNRNLIPSRGSDRSSLTPCRVSFASYCFGALKTPLG